jgi:phage gpG-like protein
MFTVEVVDSEASRLLGRLAGLSGDIRWFLKDIGDLVLNSSLKTFETSHDPYGAPWQPLKSSTVAKRRKGKGSGGHKILLDTGALRNSLHAKVEGDSVLIGTDRVYGPTHEFGATINRAPYSSWVRLRKNAAGRSVFAKDRHKKARTVRYTTGPYTIKIPARPFLPDSRGLPPSMESEIVQMIQRLIRLTPV